MTSIRPSAAYSAFTNRRYIKYYIVVILIATLFIVTRRNYLDPEKLNLNEYTLAEKEVIVNIQKSKFAINSGYNYFRLEKINFENEKTLIDTFPLAYKLFRNHKAEEISYKDGCIIVTLKSHDDNFGYTVECLRTGGPNDCGDYSVEGNDSAVEKDVPLKNGWRYQRAKFFAF